MSMEETGKLELRKGKVKSWIKNPFNFAFLGIMLIAFSLRLYYFFITKNQALWWDELSYGGIAKTNFFYGYLGNAPEMIINEIKIRPPLLPLLWSLLLKIGSTEAISKFFLELIPSVLSVILVYIIGKKIYDKKTALISSFILAISWMHIFYTMRMLTS